MLMSVTGIPSSLGSNLQVGISSRGVGEDMDERSYNRVEVYDFLAKLVESYPDDAVGMLKDIIVGYWLLPHGDGTEYAELNDLEKKVADLINSDQKLAAIKYVRDVSGLSLAESKAFVEQRDWPSDKKNDLAEKVRNKTVRKALLKLAKDFKIPLEE